MHDFQSRSLYDIYNVQLTFRDKICGGMPKNPELLKGWIAATTKHEDELTDKQVEEAREALLEPTQDKSWNTFPADDKGLFIWCRAVKALFKESASMLRVNTQRLGSKQIFQHGFEIKPTGAALAAAMGVKQVLENGTRVVGKQKHDRIYLGKTAPDGYDEGPIHVQTPQGPRSAIKRVDYATDVVLEFEVWVLHTAPAEKRHVGEDELVEMLRFGQENGLGADRSQGHGKFDVTHFELLQTGQVRSFVSSEEKKAPKKKDKSEKDGTEK